ncbi:hypothetical protein EXIGLDRAFT_348605 [Exidia glandulosa HHB12029]|uniref:Uncharacterized protein n=1 Tax=Exidia glandulosa HHB12029 TaxID=1314781 RepID=A0A165LEN4_EXIGL|nr:hypothetical protein EXIGLDRAFT_348605 [Exidia glandulosa HHB12029]
MTRDGAPAVRAGAPRFPLLVPRDEALVAEHVESPQAQDRVRVLRRCKADDHGGDWYLRAGFIRCEPLYWCCGVHHLCGGEGGVSEAQVHKNCLFVKKRVKRAVRWYVAQGDLEPLRVLTRTDGPEDVCGFDDGVGILD